MRSVRCVGGPLHGQTFAVASTTLRAPMSRGPINTVHSPSPSLDPGLNMTITYELRRICIPVSTKGINWECHEWILVPTWLSERSAVDGLRSLGYIFDQGRTVIRHEPRRDDD